MDVAVTHAYLALPKPPHLRLRAVPDGLRGDMSEFHEELDHLVGTVESCNRLRFKLRKSLVPICEPGCRGMCLVAPSGAKIP